MKVNKQINTITEQMNLVAKTVCITEPFWALAFLSHRNILGGLNSYDIRAIESIKKELKKNPVAKKNPSVITESIDFLSNTDLLRFKTEQKDLSKVFSLISSQDSRTHALILSKYSGIKGVRITIDIPKTKKIDWELLGKEIKTKTIQDLATNELFSVLKVSDTWGDISKSGYAENKKPLSSGKLEASFVISSPNHKSWLLQHILQLARFYIEPVLKIVEQKKEQPKDLLIEESDQRINSIKNRTKGIFIPGKVKSKKTIEVTDEPLAYNKPKIDLLRQIAEEEQKSAKTEDFICEMADSNLGYWLKINIPKEQVQ